MPTRENRRSSGTMRLQENLNSSWEQEHGNGNAPVPARWQGRMRAERSVSKLGDVPPLKEQAPGNPPLLPTAHPSCLPRHDSF